MPMKILVSEQSFMSETAKLIRMLSKPAAWGSGWTSAILCLSAASGYWLAGERKRAIVWLALGVIEISAIVL